MTFLRRFFALVIPSPLAGFVSILTALGVGYLLWMELEPAPRQILNADAPQWMGEFDHIATFSPDGKTLVVHFVSPGGNSEDPNRRPRRAAIHLFDLAANKRIVVTEEFDPPIIFSPDGKQIAGFWEHTVYVWDRDTGKERKRYSVKATRKKVPEPLLAFMPEGLVVWIDWSLDENEMVQRHMLALETNQPWQGNVSDFDRSHDEQQSRWTDSRTSANGKRSIARGKAGYVANDADGGPAVSIPISNRLETFGGEAISPDGTTLLIHGRIWLPAQTAFAWLACAFADGRDPESSEGVLLVDIDSGAEVAYLKGRGEVGVAPDSKSLVLAERWGTGSSRFAVYDWPLAKPWWRIVGGALLAFVALVLISKAWRWLRGKRKPEEEDAPRTRPPWETETETAD